MGNNYLDNEILARIGEQAKFTIDLLEKDEHVKDCDFMTIVVEVCRLTLIDCKIKCVCVGDELESEVVRKSLIYETIFYNEVAEEIENRFCENKIPDKLKSLKDFVIDCKLNNQMIMLMGAFGKKESSVCVGACCGRECFVTSLLDYTFYEVFYLKYKGKYNVLMPFFNGLDKVMLNKVFEAFELFSKWGSNYPKNGNIQHLKEYYDVKPRFELSSIYAEAERVKQEKANETNAPKEIKTDTLDYSKRKLCFDLEYSREQINRVFEVLVNCACVRNDEKVKNNLFDVFCSKDTATLQDVKIEWLGNINKLSALIRKVCMIKGKGDTCMWKIGERYFVKDGKPISNNALSDGGQKDSKAIEQFEKAIESCCK